MKRCSLNKIASVTLRLRLDRNAVLGEEIPAEEGTVVVARAGPTYEELARNEMGEVCMSTPAVSDGVMIVRTQKHVYGLGEKKPG